MLTQDKENHDWKENNIIILQDKKKLWYKPKK